MSTWTNFKSQLMDIINSTALLCEHRIPIYLKDTPIESMSTQTNCKYWLMGYRNSTYCVNTAYQHTWNDRPVESMSTRTNSKY